MKQQRKTGVMRVIILILYGITCLIWAALCFRDGIGGADGFLRFACAAAWCFGFFVQLHRFRKEKKDSLNRRT